MKQIHPEIDRCTPIALTAFLLLFVLSASPRASAQAATWTVNNAYQAYTAYTSPDPTDPAYFFLGPNDFSWSDPTGNGTRYSIIVDRQGGSDWNTFWQEAEKIELAEDAYYWAVKNGTPSKYADQVDQLCQGFIDKMKPVTNFGTGAPAGGGDPYNWHGTGFKDTNYSAETTNNPTGPGDWFNDDLMWAAMVFARAYQITGTPGWLTAAENQVDYVWNNAQAWTNSADGGPDDHATAVGLLQSFCNRNDGKDSDCSIPAPANPPWHPNLDAEVNFTFVIAADLLANNDSSKSGQYQAERDAVYNWAMANLYSETSDKAKACVQNAANLGVTGITCAEIFDSNNTGNYSADDTNPTNTTNTGFNGEKGYWSSYPIAAISGTDFSMNYGTAIQAAVRKGEYARAQNIANFLMYGLDNSNHPYAGTYQWDSTHTYNILPYYGPWANQLVDGGGLGLLPIVEFLPAGYDEGGNYAGSNGIALRGVAYGLSRNVLDNNTLQWAEANVQAAWNNKNGDNVMWDNWRPGYITASFQYPGVTADYVFNSWDCSDAVAGLLTVPAP